MYSLSLFRFLIFTAGDVLQSLELYRFQRASFRSFRSIERVDFGLSLRTGQLLNLRDTVQNAVESIVNRCKPSRQSTLHNPPRSEACDGECTLRTCPAVILYLFLFLLPPPCSKKY